MEFGPQPEPVAADDATVLEEVGTTMVNDQENGVVDTEEEEEEKVSVNVDDDERKED